jgi:hypothetical protein
MNAGPRCCNHLDACLLVKREDMFCLSALGLASIPAAVTYYHRVLLELHLAAFSGAVEPRASGADCQY